MWKGTPLYADAGQMYASKPEGAFSISPSEGTEKQQRA